MVECFKHNYYCEDEDYCPWCEIHRWQNIAGQREHTIDRLKQRIRELSNDRRELMDIARDRRRQIVDLQSIVDRYRPRKPIDTQDLVDILSDDDMWTEL